MKKSGSSGEQLKEAQAINKSLSALGDVISALATEQAHIPYRNQKLTMLMSDSLGGSAKTLMFVNVSPTDSNLDETQTSLQVRCAVMLGLPTIEASAGPPSLAQCARDAVEKVPLFRLGPHFVPALPAKIATASLRFELLGLTWRLVWRWRAPEEGLLWGRSMRRGCAPSRTTSRGMRPVRT